MPFSPSPTNFECIDGPVLIEIACDLHTMVIDRVKPASKGSGVIRVHPATKMGDIIPPIAINIGEALGTLLARVGCRAKGAFDFPQRAILISKNSGLTGVATEVSGAIGEG